MWRIVRIYLRLTGIFVVGIGLAVVLAGSRQTYHDPFAPYVAVMPGQPSELLKAYACNSFKDSAPTANCMVALKDGPFSSVQVAYDYTIQRMDFTVRPGSLHLSDLILCWGKPARLTPSTTLDTVEWMQIGWDNQRSVLVAAEEKNTHPPYRLPIYKVSVRGPWQPCRASQ